MDKANVAGRPDNVLNGVSNTTTDQMGNGESACMEMSLQQQQEVLSILAMLPSSSAAQGNNRNVRIKANNSNGGDDASFEGEYNSGDEEGKPLPDDAEFSGGLNSREATASTVANGGVFDDSSEPHNNGEGKSVLSSKSKQTTLESTKLSSVNRNNTGTKETKTSSTSSSVSRYYFGKPKIVQSVGTFTEIGSVLGPFFCLGQLGKGTFSSIHKCINMNYFYSRSDEGNETTRRRLAAAKVELVSFQQSGVLEAEATILDYLHKSLPPGTVPVYMGHYKSDEFAAIFMEYLPGEDMHQLREHVMARTTAEFNQSLDDGTNVSTNISPPTRRMNVNDAVYLTADVMLPLLQRMHEVGVVHRDVKPSNCVRSSNGPESKQFCMVDFGLSKSIIVPEDSEYADKEHVWDGKHWLKPYAYQNSENTLKGCYRIERKKADFRGTSMYASLRVHQYNDYCPRDDVWSLLYVFCDLVSGGLPWMQHAASRDRDACQRYKERVHGESEGGNSSEPEIAELLKGDIYHKAVHQREKSLESGIAEDKLPPLPTPLAMSEESTKIQSLSIAFNHVSKLKFWEKPDYKLIQECIRVFARGSNSKDPIIRQVNWDIDDEERSNESVKRRKRKKSGWQFSDESDPIDKLEEDIFDLSDELMETQRNNDTFINRIPLEQRFRIAQLDYNVSVARLTKANTFNIPLHRALNDWMTVTTDLLYKEWDTKRYEDGGHRTSTDGFRRDCYLQLLEKCRRYAKKFHDFGDRDVMYFPSSQLSLPHSASQTSVSELDHKSTDESDNQTRLKRRRILLTADSSPSPSTDLIQISKCIFGLEAAIRVEQSKKSAPPVRISFG